MSDEVVSSQVPAVFSSKERAALVARALSEAARRARFSTKRRGGTGGARARRGTELLRQLRIWTFLGIVLIPSLAFAGYIFGLASPQYVAQARFTVRGGLPAGMDSIGKNGSVPMMLIIQDTQVILQFIRSRAMVESLDRSVGYQNLFQGDHIDWLSRLQPDQAIEKVVQYWNKHMSMSVQLPSGICTFDVRAFSPDEAVRIADAALDASENIVNDMNNKMRDDASALADSERKRAQTSLAVARANLERARNSEGMLNATESSKGVLKLIEDVEGQLLKMQQEYDSQRRYVRADAPQLRNLQTKIDAAQKQIDSLKAQLTRAPDDASAGKAVVDRSGTGATGNLVAGSLVAGSLAAGRGPISGSMSRLESAQLEDQIAEKIYAVSLAAVEQAHVASESKVMYINTFVHPIAAQQSEYPRRGLDMAAFVLVVSTVWAALMGGLTLARSSLA